MHSDDPARRTSSCRRPGSISPTIGVGRTDWVRSPLPPNRTGGSPASSSPVDGSPARGLTDLSIGVVQGEKPMFGKEGIGPPDIVEAARDPGAPVLLAQDVAQPSTEPAVERGKSRAVTVFEVLKPAAQRWVEVLDDLGQAVPRRALGLSPDRVFEFLQALACAAGDR